MITKALLTLLVLLVAYRTLNLYRNYLAARKIGLPIIVSPFTWQDPLWAVFGDKFAFLQRLPFGSWYKYSFIGWNLRDRFDTHQRLGGAFTIVSPGRNEIVLCHTDNLREIMGKYRRWHRPRELYSIFACLGENVDSVDGEEWQKHRKVVNSAFQEKNMPLVWESARKQADQWLTGGKTCDLKELADDCDTLSGNVLMYTTFGRDYDFVKGTKEIPSGHERSFYEVMQFMLKNIILVWILRKLELPRLIEPKKMRKFREIKQELLAYFDETLARKDGDLVKALLEANEHEKIAGRGTLTQDELYGNLFIIQLAGQDTTSFSIQFCAAMLATHPDVQEWARQEIRDYEDFDKAVRLRAVMFETLRVYGAAPAIVRESPNVERMTINGKEVVVPARTFVAWNASGQSHDPTLWGEDVAEWKPQRWIEVVDGQEAIKDDMPELLSWSTGPRNCPGKKFSQVEFVAVMSKMLTDYRLEGGAGLQEVIDDFEFRVTPKPKRPEAGHITFMKR